ncbi:MAG TPA: HlyD family type I secretion periplasmic adaptor subunit [Bosea sp. (in: a-proteobacteria)]
MRRSKRVGQFRDEIGGLRSQQVARDHQATLIEQELVSVRYLHAKDLVSLSRKVALERDAAGLEGQKGQLVDSIAQAEGKIAETELQAIQIDDALREEVMKDLREIQSKTGELVERRIAAEDKLKRIDIRAPMAGFVHQLAVHTVGGVITPAEPAMLIVPTEDGLQLETRVNPPDIDQVALGQRAQVQLHAFNQRTTPELVGPVERISADTSRDQQTGAIFYMIRVAVAPAELARFAPLRIVAGMQADVFMKTEDRSPPEFIVKPLRDQIGKAFKER